MKFVTWWVEIVEDNMKDDDELTAGDRKRRSCYFCFWDKNWCISKVGFGLGVHLSSHKYPFNIQKRNSNETVLDFELQEV